MKTFRVIVCSCCAVAHAFAQSTERFSLRNNGTQVNQASASAALSSDARLAAFVSGAPTIVVGDTNGKNDVFLRDRVAATTERVSVGSGGVEGNSDSGSPALDSTGRFVLFITYASNFVANDVNNTADVFIRDRTLGLTECVSVSSAGVLSNAQCPHASLSSNGWVVAFESHGNNLVAGDTNGASDIFVRDRLSTTTERVSVSSSGAQSNGFTFQPVISADGRWIAFRGPASNLVPGDTNGLDDVFVRDRASQLTLRVSIATGGAQSNGFSEYPSISPDGRFVAFYSEATNLVLGDVNGVADIFLHDQVAATTELVSVGIGGAADADSYFSAISAGGRYVAIQSAASNLVAGDNNTSMDVFVRDRLDNSTQRVSTSSLGTEADGGSGFPAITPDGRFVAFESVATNLVANDTNANRDVFLRDRWPAGGVAYCTSGTSSGGCTPSLAGSGNASVSSASGFALSATGVDGLRSGLLFYGVSGAMAAPWGAGTSTLCVTMPVQRMSAGTSGGTGGACDGALSEDWNTFRSAHGLALGQPFAAGDTVWAQGWYRDPPAPKTTGLTNAVSFAVSP